RHPRNTKLMDITLIDAIASILKKDGIDIDQEVNLLRMKEHAVQDRPVDLLASYYCQRSYHNFFVKNKPFFFESRQKESTFYFVSNGEDDLIFDFVYRAMTDEVKITLNDQPTPVASVAATGQWTPVRFVVRKELLQAGLNELKITWPYVSQPLTVNGALTAESFLTALFPVIGEVSRLTVMSGE
ncbi:MAG: hydrolase family protein, partial [Bacteroidetes bacterium]|nr:hydrolase family protein [Bacteroidota bacterium]